MTIAPAESIAGILGRTLASVGFKMNFSTWRHHQMWFLKEKGGRENNTVILDQLIAERCGDEMISELDD